MNKNSKEKSYEINFVRVKYFHDNVLLTTDHGGWIILTKENYLKMLKHELNGVVYEKLLAKGIILTPGNIKSIIDGYKKRTQYTYGGPGLHLIIPTIHCNQKCVYCHSNAAAPSAKTGILTERIADRILGFIFQSPSPHINIEFQGGEPLLNFKMVKYIVKKALDLNKKSHKKLNFELVTNLTLLNDEIIDFIVDSKIGICTSLDGSKDIHNMNRKFFDGNATYDTVIKMVDKLKKRDIRIGMIMVTTRYSLPYWKEIIDEYVKFGQKRIRIKFLDYLGFAKPGWEKIGYTVEEFLGFWEKAVDYIFELNRKGVLIIESNVELILQKLYGEIEPNFLDLRNPCGIVSGQLAYNYNGDIYACDEARCDKYYILGNVMKDSYESILRSEEAKKFISSSINENYLCDACVFKPFCGICPVLSRAENNSLMTNLPKDSHCKIFKSIFAYVFEKIINDYETLKKVFLGFTLKNILESKLREQKPRLP